jgi:hypothetical protein
LIREYPETKEVQAICARIMGYPAEKNVSARAAHEEVRQVLARIASQSEFFPEEEGAAGDDAERDDSYLGLLLRQEGFYK